MGFINEYTNSTKENESSTNQESLKEETDNLIPTQSESPGMDLCAKMLKKHQENPTNTEEQDCEPQGSDWEDEFMFSMSMPGSKEPSRCTTPENHPDPHEYNSLLMGEF